MGVDRLSTNDAMELAIDRGSVPMHLGAALLFDADTAPDTGSLCAVLADRVVAVPRLRCLLRRTPPGCGRPVWAPDPHFSLGRHLEVATLARTLDGRPGRRGNARGDPGAAARDRETDLYAAAMRLLLAPLPRDRPLWRARLLRDSRGRAQALVLVLHHVTSDGIGGLAVLRALADGAGKPNEAQMPSADAYTAVALARDAWGERLRALRRLPGAMRALGWGVGELRLGRPVLAGRTTLLAPTSSARRLDVAQVGLRPVQAAAHRAGATVNDLLLLAVGATLGRLLGSRGERLGTVVVSVPVSARAAATAGRIGNEVGIMPVHVPVHGTAAERLAAVTRQTHRLGEVPARGRSAGVLSPAFRTLATTGAYPWFIARQRLVHTFETNVRGPAEPVSMAGGVVSRIVPLTASPGNVTVTFAVLSYAGRLLVSVVTDPVHVPEHDLLAPWLEVELGLLCGGARERATA